ncbi:hypothetical protein EON65_54255, partial [archaeon]
MRLLLLLRDPLELLLLFLHDPLDLLLLLIDPLVEGSLKSQQVTSIFLQMSLSGFISLQFCYKLIYTVIRSILVVYSMRLIGCLNAFICICFAVQLTPMSDDEGGEGTEHDDSSPDAPVFNALHATSSANALHPSLSTTSSEGG